MYIIEIIDLLKMEKKPQNNWVKKERYLIRCGICSVYYG